MRDSFGARLRRQREDRGVSLAEIAERTKIKASLLDGLERDDISLWPAGIFRRAYVRAYADAIGVDPDGAVREFLALNPDPIDMTETAAPQATGLRGLFGGFRRRTPASILAPPTPGGPQTSHGVTATVGKRPAEPPLEPAAPEPAVAEPPVAEPSTAEPFAVEPPVAVPATPPLASALPPSPPAEVAASVTAQPAGGQDALLAAAQICTELGRVDDVAQVLPLLADAAKILGARGLIVWVWDAATEQLEPAFVHGYPSKVRARLRGVKASADNVTAAAYRACAPLARSGALAVPLLAPAGSAGVLAIEVDHGREQDAEVRALATFFAAMLAQLVGSAAAEAAESSPATQRESTQEAAARLG